MNEKILLSFLCSVFITTTTVQSSEKSVQTEAFQSEDSAQTELSLQKLAAQLKQGEKITALPLILAIDASGNVRIIDPDKFIPQSDQQQTVQLPLTDYDLFKEALVLCAEGTYKGTTGVLILTLLGGKVVFHTTVKAGAITWGFLKYLIYDVIVPKITAANNPVPVDDDDQIDT